MNKLQQLLNEKYPDVTEISHIQRQAFTEGYNAAKDEAKQAIVTDDDLRIFHARMQENITPTANPIP